MCTVALQHSIKSLHVLHLELRDGYLRRESRKASVISHPTVRKLAEGKFEGHVDVDKIEELPRSYHGDRNATNWNTWCLLMTEDRLQTLEEVQCNILAILERVICGFTIGKASSCTTCNSSFRILIVSCTSCT